MSETRISNTYGNDSEQPFHHHSLEDWQAIATKSLRGESLDSLSHTTASGLSINPLYTERPETAETTSPLPLQRWDNRLAVLGDNAIAQNTSLLAGLTGGISSAQLQLDDQLQPSPISSDDLSTVLKNVQVEIIPISLMAGVHFSDAAQKLKSIWSAQNISAEIATAHINADPVGTLACTGSMSTKLDKLLFDMALLAQQTHSTFRQVKTVCVNSTYYHNAGASLEQELVASMATSAIYMQSMLDAGMNAQSAHDTMTFQISCDADTLANVVKIRALKALWHHVAKQFGVAQPAMQLVVETSLRMQSVNHPWVNHLRNVSAAAAAAMGGAQSIIVHPHNRVDGVFVDDNIDLGNRVARNIAIILAEESAMTFVHDPMGGSYAIENLTDALCKDTWSALQNLENNGGLIQALKSGHWQDQLSNTQKQRVDRLHNESDIKVSVNRYTTKASSNHLQSNPIVDSAKKNHDVLALRTVREAAAFEVTS